MERVGLIWPAGPSWLHAGLVTMGWRHRTALNADTIPDAKGTCGWSIKKQSAFGINGAKR
jgi:hypothetical protein